jgi:hypothetical protein
MKTKFNFQFIASVFFVIALCFIPDISNAQLGKLPKVKTPVDKKTESSASPGSSVAAASANTPAANKAFTENKEDIDSCKKYLEVFIYEQDNDEFIKMANNINNIINQGDKIVADIHTNIPDIAEFEKVNEDAKSCHLKSKVGFLESDLEKAKTRFSDIKQYLLTDVDDGVYLSKMAEVDAQGTAKVLDDINNYFVLLDKFFPGDADVEASRKTNIPVVKAEYDKKMKAVGSNRMAPSKYTGADKATLEKQLIAAYNKRYTGDIVKRVSITDPSWTQKTELIDDNTKMYWRTSNYIGAHIAVQKDKVCNVFIVTFRKDKSTGNIELYSAGTNYPVLVENISK